MNIYNNNERLVLPPKGSTNEFTDEEAREIAKELYAAALKRAKNTEEPIPMPYDDGDLLVDRIVDDLSSD